MSEPIRFAILGLGHIGRRHATIVDAHPDCSLVALSDILPAEQLDLSAFHQPYFQGLQRLLAEAPLFDVLCVCTPNGLHAQHAIEALQARKHVVIEKPMGLHKAECEQVIFKALQMSRQVFCVMQNRYSPCIAWAKEIMEQQRLGRLQQVAIDCFWNRDHRYYRLPDGRPHPWHGCRNLDGGTLFTQFAHFVDILYWLFGDVTDIQASFQDLSHRELTDFEDAGAVQFRFVNGGLGSINFSTAVWRHNFESSITLLGERGTVKIGGQYMNEIVHCDIEHYELPELPPANPPNDYGPYQGSAANHHFVIQNVVDVLRGQQPVSTNALEGLKVVDIIERIYAAGRDQRQQIWEASRR